MDVTFNVPSDCLIIFSELWSSNRWHDNWSQLLWELALQAAGNARKTEEVSYCRCSGQPFFTNCNNNGYAGTDIPP